MSKLLFKYRNIYNFVKIIWFLFQLIFLEILQTISEKLKPSLKQKIQKFCENLDNSFGITVVLHFTHLIVNVQNTVEKQIDNLGATISKKYGKITQYQRVNEINFFFSLCVVLFTDSIV